MEALQLEILSTPPFSFFPVWKLEKKENTHKTKKRKKKKREREILQQQSSDSAVGKGKQTKYLSHNGKRHKHVTKLKARSLQEFPSWKTKQNKQVKPKTIPYPH